MADPSDHAKSSARRWGGIPEDYIRFHAWFDETKRANTDPRHRAGRHHAEGIGWMIDYFMARDSLDIPETINSDGKAVPLRYIGEQHVIEDMGFIPTLEEWYEDMPLKSWMALGAHKIHKDIERGKFDPRPIPSEETDGSTERTA